jgi:hypothetical protein
MAIVLRWRPFSRVTTSLAPAAADLPGAATQAAFGHPGVVWRGVARRSFWAAVCIMAGRVRIRLLRPRLPLRLPGLLCACSDPAYGAGDTSAMSLCRGHFFTLIADQSCFPDIEYLFIEHLYRIPLYIAYH